MRSIKVHLETEAYAPVQRLAHQLHVSPEDIVYAGLNRIMKDAASASIQQEIADAIACRKNALPSWADRAHEVHAYESM